MHLQRGTYDANYPVTAWLLASVLLSASLLDLLSAESFLQPATWVKLGYALALALAAGLVTAALAKRSRGWAGFLRSPR